MNRDITDQVEFGDVINDFLVLKKCTCGNEFKYGSFLVRIYDDSSAATCPNCGRKLFFRLAVRVYEMIEGE